MTTSAVNEDEDDIMSTPVVFTINALTVGQGKETPTDWESAGRSIDSFVNIVLGAGIPVTIFATPEAARAHTPMFEEFVDRGCQIGLLLIPPQSPLIQAKKHVGVLDVAQQEASLVHAKTLFQEFMGYRPTVLRTGLHSGSVDFFRLCQKHNFTHTSIRLPGAQLSQIGTVWPNEDVHVVETHGVVDIPVTTDPEHRLFNRFPLYLSSEISENGRHAELIARGHLHGHICVTASNVAPYWDPSQSATQNLYSLIDALSDQEMYTTPLLHQLRPKLT
jgi:hypothetical protein